jgi:hypothetical protein
MPQTETHRSRSAAAVAPFLLLACLMLAACGGSSSKTTSSATASASTTSTGAKSTTNGTTPTGKPAPGAAAGRFAALRECLKKDGITLPKRTPGQRRRPGGGGFLGGGGAAPQLPKGVTRAQYEAALKKCGGGAFGRPRSANPVFTRALVKFADCMRADGVKIPEPNTSGKGPIFTTKGINTSSAQFRAAETKCSADLRSSFGGGGARGGTAPGSPGAPPTTG